jgi:tripartite-type tricarboxylate transporter receptor subunit TctC
MLATGPMLLVVGADTPYKTTSDLLDAARQAKGGLNYGSAGIGSLHHLSGELLTSMGKVDMSHVPYKGSAPAVQDLIAGRIQTMVASLPATIGHIKGGRLRALAVTTPVRSKLAPELPTLASTVPGYQVDIWWGVFAPGGTPQPMLDRLNAELRAVIGSPEMRETFDREGADPASMSAAESNAFYRADIEKWRGIARQRNIVVE